MKILLALLLFAALLPAQVVTISDTIRNATGSLASGDVAISWPSFIAGDGTAVAGGFQNLSFSAGVFSTTLYPNTGATPAGTSYAVTIQISGGGRSSETWVVPTGGPHTIAVVRVATVPAPDISVNPAQLTQAGATTNECLVWNGSAWAPGSCSVGGSGITSLGGQTGSVQTFANDTNVQMSSATDTHTLTWAGTLGLSRGGTNADLSATGGAGQVLRQSTVGGNVSVSALADADIPNTITLDNLTQVTTRDYSDLQNIPASFTPSAHASTHQHSGGDEVATATPAANVIPKAGAGGTIADGFIPQSGVTQHQAALSVTASQVSDQNAGTDITADLEEEAHATEHQHGGADEVATATAGANAIPKAGAGGTLADGWIPEGGVTQHQAALSITASQLSDQNAGTDVTADLEEEAHASEHTAGGADIVTVDGTDAGAATTRTNPNPIKLSRHDTDCTSLTDGTAGEPCWEKDANVLYICEPTAGGCDTAGEWVAMTAAGDGTGYDTIQDEGSGLTQRGTLNFAGAGVSCADDTTRTTCTISGGGSGVTVEEADASPSVSATTIQFDQADGFTATDETGGQVQIDLVNAPDSAVADDITLTNITQITNRAIGDTTGDLPLGTRTSGNYVEDVAAGTGIAVTGAAGEGATKTPAFDFSDAGADPALNAEECRFSNEGASDGGWVCEGATADTIEARFHVTDPTGSDKVYTFPDATGEVSLLGQTIETGEADAAFITTSDPITDLSDVTAKTGSGTTAVFNDTPTLLTPTIASFANANHNHQDAAGGGTLAKAALPAAIAYEDEANIFTSTLDIDNNQRLRMLEPDGNGSNYLEFVHGNVDRTTDVQVSWQNITGPCAGANGGTLTLNGTAPNLTIDCEDDDGGAGGSGDAIEVEQGDDSGTFDPIDTTARFDDSGDINFTFADGGAGGPDVITATVRADSVALTTDTTGNYTATIADAGNSTIAVVNGTAEGGAVTLDAIDLNCTDCIGTTEIADSYLLNTGDAIAGNLDFNDGTGDTPAATFTPQTGTAFSILVEDTTDDMRVTANTTATENVEFENTGTGVMDVLVETADGVLTSVKAGESITTGTVDQARLDANVVMDNEANTYTTGAQDFSSASSLILPVAAGAAPTANGTVAYDPTDNDLEYGDNGTNRKFANLAEAQTFTNKTVDEANNSIILSHFIEYAAAGCQDTAAFSGFNWTGTNAPNAPACISGTNVRSASLGFADSVTDGIQGSFRLPPDWTGAIDVDGMWRSTTGSTNVVRFTIATICVADGETMDPAFNSAQNIDDAGKGTPSQVNSFALTSITTTGCAADELFFWRLQRLGGVAEDTFGGTADLLKLRFKIRRDH